VPVTSANSPATEKPVVVPARKRHRFARFMLWFLGIVLLLEFGLRLFGYGSYVLYRPDAQLLWVPVPGSHKITETNHLPITINADGFRYQQDLGAKQEGQYRVMTFGDSVTMGWGVDDNSTYSAVLEKLLNADCSGIKFQVVDAGVNAYPNALVAERLKKALDDNYQPDAVVLAYSFNTGFERLAKLQGKEREQLLHRVEMKSMARRSALYNFLIEDLLREVMYYRFRELLLQGSWDTAKEHQVVDIDQFIGGLNEAKQAAQAHHVQLVLLLLGSEGETSEVHPYQKAMVEFARKNNVSIVDMISVLRAREQKGLFMDHVHPTAAGHALIAHSLAGTFHGLDSYAAVCKNDTNRSLVVSKR
jgi:lysophospholipase L1-like esterase